MTTLDDFRDADGYLHRIDAVPAVGRVVNIKTTDGLSVNATVIEAGLHNGSFRGIGCEVAYRNALDEIIPAVRVERWGYIDGGRADEDFYDGVSCCNGVGCAECEG